MSLARLAEKPRALIWSALVIYALLHLYQLNAPPNGYHMWRESDTAAVAMNYFQEDMNFLHPRVNQRGATTGITGIELPIYNYTVALLYHLTGPLHATARMVTLLFACLGLWMFGRLVALLSGERIAAFAVWGLAFSPLYFFYGFKIMPDIWMITFLITAFYFFVRYRQRECLSCLIWSAIFLILSGCLKPLGLSIYLPFLYLVWGDRTGRARRLIYFAAYVLVTFSAVLGWFLYARSVNELHDSGGFYMGHLIPRWLEFAMTDMFVKKLLAQWPFELWVGWVFVPAFLLGVYHSIKERTGGLLVIWILACYIVFFATSAHARSHDYYALIILPPIATITGIGLERLVRAGSYERWIAVILMLAVPIGTSARIMHRFADVPEFEPMRADADRLIPMNDLVMTEEGTSAIKLYQLNRHGWAVRGGIGYSSIKQMVDQGGRFLILEHPIDQYNDSLLQLFPTEAKNVGPFYCYRAKNWIDPTE